MKWLSLCPVKGFWFAGLSSWETESVPIDITEWMIKGHLTHRCVYIYIRVCVSVCVFLNFITRKDCKSNKATAFVQWPRRGQWPVVQPHLEIFSIFPFLFSFPSPRPSSWLWSPSIWIQVPPSYLCGPSTKALNCIWDPLSYFRGPPIFGDSFDALTPLQVTVSVLYGAAALLL